MASPNDPHAFRHTFRHLAARDLKFFLNGEQVTISKPDPSVMLIDYLRSEEVGLTGAKLSCGEGGCGACTVMLSSFDPVNKCVNHRAINACLRPLVSLDGMLVTTVEGTGDVRRQISAVQHEIAVGNGSQCGYCTSGFVMNMHAHLNRCAARDMSPGTKREVEDLFDGNICRCTGFRPILQAMKRFANDWEPDGYVEQSSPQCEVNPGDYPVCNTPNNFFEQKHSLRAYRGLYKTLTQDVPDEMLSGPRAVYYPGRHCGWYRPLTLKDALLIQASYADQGTPCRIVHGNTSIGVYPEEAGGRMEPYDFHPRALIDVGKLPQLMPLSLPPRVSQDDVQRCCRTGKLHVNTGTTYTEFLEQLNSLEKFFAKSARDRSAQLVIRELKYMASRTAGTVVRNSATLGGNTMLVASHATQGKPFPSDLFVVMQALRTTVTVASLAWGTERRPVGNRRFQLGEFVAKFNDPHDPDGEVLRSRSIITQYQIPLVGFEAVRAFKVARRHDNSHSLVNACMCIREARRAASIVVGGISNLPFHAEAAESVLSSAEGGDEFIRREALFALRHDVASNEVGEQEDGRTEGVTIEYKRSLVESFLFKFMTESFAPRKGSDLETSTSRLLGDSQRSRPVSWGTQRFAEPDELNGLGKPYVKLSSFLQATGQAEYTTDIPLPKRGLQAALVTSKAALANFKWVAPRTGKAGVKAVLSHLQHRFPKVHDLITVDDLPNPGYFHGDDPFFCDKQVTCYGQPLGLIVAEDERIALSAAAYTRDYCVKYTNQKKPILSLVDARRKQSFLYSAPAPIEREGSDMSWVGGNSHDVNLNGVDCHVAKGQLDVGSQIHFYMEPQACLVIPGENSTLEVHPAAQNPRGVQNVIADTLGIDANQINVVVRRLGGSYGGKDCRSIFVAVPAAVAAWKLNRAVRLVMPRDEDTNMIGHRHAYHGEYELAISKSSSIDAKKGQILGWSTELWSDGGNTKDVSMPVLKFGMINGDCAYNVRNFRLAGNVCKTNKTSSTACRSFGFVQTALIQEEAVERASHEIGMLPEKVREVNLYKQGAYVPWATKEDIEQKKIVGGQLKHCYLTTVWNRLKKQCEFTRREKEIQEFNSQHRWRKRGICMMPLKYGLGWLCGQEEQATALVNVYARDGTVLIEHGGVEIGQGLMTKVAQVAAFALDIPLSMIRVVDTASYVNPNPISTSASSTSDIYCSTVNKACQILAERVRKFCRKIRRKHYNDDWCQKKGMDYWTDGKRWGDTAPNGRTYWANIVQQAFENRINLAEQTIYFRHSMDVDSYKQFYAYTYSAGCTEAEIDVLTGEVTLHRADLMYDMGRSMNPAIDVGQIEGAFVQGLGYVLTEELVWQQTGPEQGALNTLNTWSYKPPAAKTIPIEMNVDLFPRSASSVPDNPNLTLSSKAVGEPPLVLASTAFFAVKRAVRAARQDLLGDDSWPEMRAPATVEQVRRACGFDLVEHGFQSE